MPLCAVVTGYVPLKPDELRVNMCLCINVCVCELCVNLQHAFLATSLVSLSLPPHPFSRSLPCALLQGKVRPVKVLGILCMIDEGEADWKVVAIDREDPW